MTLLENSQNNQQETHYYIGDKWIPETKLTEEDRINLEKTLRERQEQSETNGQKGWLKKTIRGLVHNDQRKQPSTKGIVRPLIQVDLPVKKNR